jgi:hypothetical protein
MHVVAVPCSALRKPGWSSSSELRWVYDVAVFDVGLTLLDGIDYNPIPPTMIDAFGGYRLQPHPPNND